MAKKKEDKFDVDTEIEKVNEFLREGLKKYIFENSIVIKSEKEFRELLEHYGGF